MDAFLSYLITALVAVIAVAIVAHIKPLRHIILGGGHPAMHAGP